MTAFRGIQSKDLVSSLLRAEQFLRGLNLGPATEERLRQWKQQVMPGTLELVDDNEKLADTMIRTRAPSLMHDFQHLFNLHAGIEAVENKDEKIRKLYRDLMAWSAFHDIPLKPDIEIQQEVSSYFITKVLEYMWDDPSVRRLMQKKLELALEMLKKENPDQAVRMEEVTPVYLFLYNCNYIDEVKKLLSSQSPAENINVRSVFYSMSGLFHYNAVLDMPEALQPYVLKIQNSDDDSEKTFWNILEDFKKTAAVGRIISKNVRDAKIYNFSAMPGVAQKLANRMPYTKVVQARDNKKIEPEIGGFSPPGP